MGEADPLVVKEALMAGLGVVVSECASANLDRNLPFIDVIPDNKLDNLEYVRGVIERNRRRKYKKIGRKIRQYALEHFSWKKVIEKYTNLISI